jgi:hypothetical protein
MHAAPHGWLLLNRRLGAYLFWSRLVPWTNGLVHWMACQHAVHFALDKRLCHATAFYSLKNAVVSCLAPVHTAVLRFEWRVLCEASGHAA